MNRREITFHAPRIGAKKSHVWRSDDLNEYSSDVLRELKIERFRSFRELTVRNCAPINLILGRNNVGKTALLEAIELLYEPDPRSLRRSPPRAILSLKEIRKAYLDGWQWSFYDGDTSQSFVLSSEDLSGGTTSVTASYLDREERSEVTLSPTEEKQDDQSILERTISVRMERLTSDQSEATVVEASLPPESSKFEVRVSGPRRARPIAILDSSRSSSRSNSPRFSRLQDAGEEKLVIETLRALDPRLTDLIVRSEFGSRGASYSSLAARIERLQRPVPVELMGEGFSSLLTIVLYILSQRGKIALIDEVENGLHYSVLEKVWRGIAEACGRRDVQLFVTSHSYECVEAAYEAFRDHPEILRVHRLDRQRDGTVVTKSFDHEHLGVALAQGLDMR